MNASQDRYHRQSLLAGIGQDGQKRLAGSTVLLLGCGALGSFSAEMLARAGVGRLVIVDRDFVELTNLQRQVLFDEKDVAEALPKAIAAKRKLALINSSIQVSAIVDDINHLNIEAIAEGSDLIVDGLDNLETRYLANDLAVKYSQPFVYGAAVGTDGMAFSVLPHGDGSAEWERPPGYATPCFRCLFEDLPPAGSTPTCDTSGVLGSLVTQIASHQVTETIKILTGNYAALSGKLLNVDAWHNDYRALNVSTAYQGGDCPACKHRRFDFLDGRAGSSAAVLCGRNAVQLRPADNAKGIDFSTIGQRLAGFGAVRSNEYMLRAALTDSGREIEITLFADGRTIVKGTDSVDAARTLYARYIGG